MLSRNTDFNLSRQCQITDVNCWRNQFQKNMNCSKDDKNCWKGLVKKLPCDLMDTQCWKKQYPDLPCDFHDKQCWKNLLPALPCKIADKECWSNLKMEQNSKNGLFSNFFNNTSIDKIQDQISQSFDRYMEYGFGII